MARYIDADELREYWLENGVNENVYNTNDVLNSIDYQPTADVVLTAVMEQIKWERDIAIEQLASYGVCLGEKKELVEVPCRCKECKHRKNGIQGYYCDLTDFLIKDDDFCSYGERRNTE